MTSAAGAVDAVSADHSASESENLRNIPFSDRLREFYSILLEIPWRSEFPGSAFIRDYEMLPERAPFDIDLMMPEAYWDRFIGRFDNIAAQCGLISIARKVSGGILILVFDPRKGEGQRTWAYNEVRKKLPLTAGIELTSDNLEISYSDNMPVPSGPWRFLLLFHQGLRKDKLRQVRSELRGMLADNPKCADLCTTYLGISNNEIDMVLANPDRTCQWRKKFGITEPGKKVDYPISARTILKRRLMRVSYAIHVGRPLLYTFHGPDGVGKSTVCAEVADILSGYPLAFATFHHVTSWKRAPEMADSRSSGNLHRVGKRDERVSLWRRILRVTYRNLPEIFRKIWTVSYGYHRYSKSLNHYILDHFVSGKIALCDRYIYDLWTKERLEMRSRHPLNLLHFLHCKALRQPRLAFVLTDEPEAVYRRKKELSLEEIGWYQRYMDKALAMLGVRTKTIPIASRSAAGVAEEVVESLLNDIGSELINLMKQSRLLQSQPPEVRPNQ